ncbi:hypothetical protein HRbin06_00292 [archaeon HR06]|nr:hypothetical protein HRbin06_00292 [archaeon HR06]
MSFEEAEILKERAEKFLFYAVKLFEDGEYDLAAFNLEQYCQLILKYKLLIKTGTYPRNHSIIKLLRELSKISPEVKQLIETEDYVIYLTKLEDAYIGATYLPRRYEKTELNVLVKFVKGVFKSFVDRI